MKIAVQLLCFVLSALLIAGPVHAGDGEALKVAVLQDMGVQVTDESGGAVADAAVSLRLPDDGATGTLPDGTHSAVAYTDADGHATFPAVRWGALDGDVAVHITATRGALHGTAIAHHVIEAVVAKAEKGADQLPASMPAAASAPSARPVQPGQPETKPVIAAPRPQLAAEVPHVSVSAPTPNDKIRGGGSSKKWIWIALVAAGAGAGAAMAMKGKAGSSTSSAPSSPGSISIGSPTVGIGN